MARQNMTVAATVATSPVLSVGFIMPTPGAYTLYKYIRAHACDSFTHDRGRRNEISFNANSLENKQNDSRDSRQP